MRVKTRFAGTAAGIVQFLAARLSICLGIFVVVAIAQTIALSATAAEPAKPLHISAKRSISAPAGFSGMCARYDWACSRSSTSTVAAAAIFETADRINRSVNIRTRQISDQKQYRRDEYWALPTRRGGDCEDLVLLKKMRLVQAGLPANALLMATVLDLRGSRHAVLVMRTKSGDFVLDSLNNRIRHWVDTGYTFLKMQNPSHPDNWDAIFAGGRLAAAQTTVIAMK